MLHIALHEPEIPPNTGNVARLCAATASRLHLVGTLGFRTDDKTLKRAGLDYWPFVDLVQHATFDDFAATMTGRIWLVETGSAVAYSRADVQDGDALVFGKESVGLPADLRERYAATMVSIPMMTKHVRSLNLSTAVGIVAYDCLRRIHGW